MKQTKLLATTRETPGIDSGHPLPPLQELSSQTKRSRGGAEIINSTN